MRIIVNRTKAILAALMVVFFGGYGVFFIVNGPAIGAVVFLAIAVAFGWLLFKYASTLTVDAEEVRLDFLGIRRKGLRWDEIKELGLIGENVFNHGKKQRTGDKYIYFSPVRMDADERFQMIVSWPPKRDIIYVEYSEKALEYCMTLWNGELKTYNVEDLFPNTGEPKGSRKK